MSKQATRAMPAYEFLSDPARPAVRFRGETLPLWTRGAELARDFLGQGQSDRGLPVLLGADPAILEALSAAATAASMTTEVAVVDAEEPILAASGVRECTWPGLDILWLDCPAEEAVGKLTAWQVRHGGKPFAPMADPAYLKIDPRRYAGLLRGLKQSREANVWERLRYPKFASALPRVLFIRFDYFLARELGGALERSGAPYAVLDAGDLSAQELGRAILDRVAAFRPDFLLSINSLGTSFRGPLADMLDLVGLPVAAWFVDSPDHYLLPGPEARTAHVAAFCCDPDCRAKLDGVRLAGIHVLPLAADAGSFDLHGAVTQRKGDIPVSFVGNSWTRKIGQCLRSRRFPPEILCGYKAPAQSFVDSPEPLLFRHLRERHPEFHCLAQDQLDAEGRKGLLILMSWEANRHYRLRCLRELLPLRPFVAGDNHWLRLLPAGSFVHHPPIGYYEGTMELYARSLVNLGNSSMQMKGSVTQRAFDVPAAGSLVLHDARPQLDALFEPGVEAVSYRGPEELRELARRWLRDDAGALRVINAARRRIVAEHTYDHRLREMFEVMRRTFA